MSLSPERRTEQRAQNGGMGTNRSKFPAIRPKKIARAEPPRRAGLILEMALGCKWSLTIYFLLNRGINRPGAMERSAAGLSAKVLNDCLRRNVEMGILEKRLFAEIPPRVEYHFTKFGRRFQKVIAAVEELQRELDDQGGGYSRTRPSGRGV